MEDLIIAIKALTAEIARLRLDVASLTTCDSASGFDGRADRLFAALRQLPDNPA